MPFANAVQTKINTLPVGSPRRAILEFLWVNARGRANVQTWEAIAGYLRKHELLIEKEAFQTGLLASTRENDVFIGSSRQGFYIIEDRDDALATMEFFKERVDAHNARLSHLNALVQGAGWERLPIAE